MTAAQQQRVFKIPICVKLPSYSDEITHTVCEILLTVRQDGLMASYELVDKNVSIKLLTSLLELTYSPQVASSVHTKISMLPYISVLCSVADTYTAIPEEFHELKDWLNLFEQPHIKSLFRSDNPKQNDTIYVLLSAFLDMPTAYDRETTYILLYRFLETYRHRKDRGINSQAIKSFIENTPDLTWSAVNMFLMSSNENFVMVGLKLYNIKFIKNQATQETLVKLLWQHNAITTDDIVAPSLLTGHIMQSVQQSYTQAGYCYHGITPYLCEILISDKYLYTHNWAACLLKSIADAILNESEDVKKDFLLIVSAIKPLIENIASLQKNTGHQKIFITNLINLSKSIDKLSKTTF